MYPFGGSVIAQEANENRQNQGMRKTKRDVPQTGTSMPHASKRAALGTITNQRVQPFRAAKQAAQTEGHFQSVCTGDENETSRVPGKSFFVPVQKQAFAIHTDDASNRKLQTIQQPLQTREHKLELNSAVTALSRQQIENASPDTICIDDEFIGSPMVLDVSDSESVQASIDDQDSLITCVPEYCQDIYRYLREAELRNRPKAHYMKKQPDITNSMRTILIDWLVEVTEEYKLHRETLFLAVNYIDRFLSQMSVLRGKLQLVGAAAMFLAAKYEEIYPPDVGEFVYITDDTYTKKQVLRMEHLVLKVLNFDVAIPTAHVFCERFLKLMGADSEVEALAMYLLESTLIESDPFLKHLPSVIAASAVCLAHHTLDSHSWKHTLYSASGYQPGELDACIRDMHSMHCAAATHPQQAVMEKYKTAKNHQVATLNPATSLPVCFH